MKKGVGFVDRVPKTASVGDDGGTDVGWLSRPTRRCSGLTLATFDAGIKDPAVALIP